MRKLIGMALAGFYLLSVTATIGCGSGEKAKIPEKTIELPGKGPTPVGGGGGAKAAPTTGASQ